MGTARAYQNVRAKLLQGYLNRVTRPGGCTQEKSEIRNSMPYSGVLGDHNLRMMKTLRCFYAGVGLLAISTAFLSAQQPAGQPADDYVRSHYTKYEFRIPMRDGKRLFTAVYVPKDASGGPYPFMMDRTPYNVGPYGEDQYPQRLGPSEEFEKSGYIFVYQDVRGRWMSEGEFQEMRPHIDEKKSPQDVDDASDTYDTIEFLINKDVSRLLKLL